MWPVRSCSCGGHLVCFSAILTGLGGIAVDVGCYCGAASQAGLVPPDPRVDPFVTAVDRAAEAQRSG
jgi:hypothetical protein